MFQILTQQSLMMENLVNAASADNEVSPTKSKWIEDNLIDAAIANNEVSPTKSNWIDAIERFIVARLRVTSGDRGTVPSPQQ